MDTNFTIRFWGVRGSYPVPGAETLDFGGNTPCVEVSVNGQTIILDAGTGIIALGRTLARQMPLDLTILFSHYHHDHTQGFPFFTPAYIPSAHLRCYGSGERSLEAILTRNQEAPAFPLTLVELRATKSFTNFQEGDMLFLGGDEPVIRRAGSTGLTLRPDASEAVVVRAHRSYAHPGGSQAYRIEFGGRSIVYATDTEGYIGTDQRLAMFARGADVLIHDAQYSEEHYRGQWTGFPCAQGYGHSTPSMACHVALAAHAKQLVLFHHDPSYPDQTIRNMEAQARALFPNAIAAYEGLEIELAGAEAQVDTRSLAATV